MKTKDYKTEGMIKQAVTWYFRNMQFGKAKPIRALDVLLGITLAPVVVPMVLGYAIVMMPFQLLANWTNK